MLKTRDAEHLIQAVRLVAGGSMVIDPDVVASLADAIAERESSDAEALSARELEVLQLLAFGHTKHGDRRTALHVQGGCKVLPGGYLQEARGL